MMRRRYGGQSEGEQAIKRTDGAALQKQLNRKRPKDENTPGAGARARTPQTTLSERRPAEAWLARHEATIRSTIEGTSDALFFLDRQGHYRYANWLASQLLGYTYGELVSMDLVDTTLDEDRPEILRLFGQLLSTGAMRCELLLKHKNGGTVPVDFNATLLPDGSVFVACRDIGEIRLAKVALKRSEEFKEAVLDSVFSAIAVLDHHGKIIAVNAAWRRFAQENGGKHTQLGVNYLDTCRNSLGDGQNNARQAYDGILAVLEGRLPRFCLEYPCHPPNRQRWFSMSVTPLNKLGHGVVITHTDVSAAKLAELERSRQKDALVREVHHRIKNNLQGVAGLLQRELGKFLERDPRLQAAISQVNAIAIVHGLQSTNSGEAILLSESVKNTCKAVSKLSRHSVEFQRNDSQGILASMWIDNAEAVAVALIVNELILNAVKHSPKDSSSPTVVLQPSGASALVLIRNAVSDTPVFDTTTGEGLGTGLRLVRSLMPKQGACLAYELDTAGAVLTKLTLSPPLLLIPSPQI